MKNFKFNLVSILILAAILICFVLPKPNYQSVLILEKLNVPFSLRDWRSEDFSKNMPKTKDDRFKFISDVFARIYGNRDGQSLLFIILDAGNFHHPRLCYGGSGFKSKDLAETRLRTGGRLQKAKTFLAQKDHESFVVIYWMCIDKRPVDWTEQKWTQLWHSLFNKKQAGLMMRIDIPVQKGNVEQAVALGEKFVSDLAAEMSVEQVEWMFGR